MNSRCIATCSPTARSEQRSGARRTPPHARQEEVEVGMRLRSKTETNGPHLLGQAVVPGRYLPILAARGEDEAHSSYHRDGTYHQKPYDRAHGVQKRQPLCKEFKGVEHLGLFSGHGAGPRPKDASRFDDVLIVEPGILEGTEGCVVVDLVEPGHRPAQHHREPLDIFAKRRYDDDDVPWIIVAVATRR